MIRCISIGLLTVVAASSAELVIIEKGTGQVGFYSTAGKLEAEVPIGGHPHEMAVSSDGRCGFTTDNGVMIMTEKTDGGNTVTVAGVATLIGGSGTDFSFSTVAFR